MIRFTKPPFFFFFFILTLLDEIKAISIPEKKAEKTIETRVTIKTVKVAESIKMH